MKVIKLDSSGRAYCWIFFKPRNKIVLSRYVFKVDTGADISTISKEYLHKLGYNDEWISSNAKPETDRQTTTATGEIVTTHILQLPLLNIYGYEAVNWPFALLLDEKRTDGTFRRRDYRPLLGLDLLAGFDFHLNNGNNAFSLTPLKLFSPRREFLPGQEIHMLHNQ